MYRSNEFIKLTKDDKEIEIHPNTKFNSIPAGYKVWNSAIILDKDNLVAKILQPGSITTELGIVKRKRRRGA